MNSVDKYLIIDLTAVNSSVHVVSNSNSVTVKCRTDVFSIISQV